MTEAEWLSWTDPTPMVEFLQGGQDQRAEVAAIRLCLLSSYMVSANG